LDSGDCGGVPCSHYRRIRSQDPIGNITSLVPIYLRNITIATPLKHVILTLQDPWLGFGSNWAELLVVAGMLLVAALLSLRLFR
jgi:hypothetical protein